MMDSFLTIKQQRSSLMKEKSSKFYSYAFPVKTNSDIDTELLKLRKEHLKAGHFCYAYFLGADRLLFRANDDGEPSGTAGRPILGQIEKRKLTDALVVVVRYFGGTKLGTSGLIKAYKESAALALDKCEIIEEIITGHLLVKCGYEEIGPLMSMVSGENLKIIKSSYLEEIEMLLEVRKSLLGKTVDKLKSLLLKRSLQDITADTQVENVSFEIIEEP